MDGNEIIDRRKLKPNLKDLRNTIKQYWRKKDKVTILRKNKTDMMIELKNSPQEFRNKIASINAESTRLRIESQSSKTSLLNQLN